MGHVLEAPKGRAVSCEAAVLEAALEASSEGLALAEHGIIDYANRAFARLVGYAHPAQLVGRPLESLRPAGYPCLRLSGEGKDCGASHLCQFITKRNGKGLRIESSCSPFVVDGREMLFVTIRDVSVRERRRMVRDEDRRFRAIFDGAPTAILQCDLRGHVLEANRAAERMLGYSRTELRGMHFREFTHPEDITKDLALFRTLARGQMESYELELRYLGKSAETRWVRLTMSLVRGATRDPQFVIAMAEDITERKLAEQRLREAQKMEVIGRLVSGVAHDFNNLLTGVTLYCDLLLAGLDRCSPLRHHAEEIRLAGEQGAALIQQLLAISRKQVVEPRVLSLNDVIQGARNLLVRLMGDKFELRTTLKKDLGWVRVDPAQVQQVLFNLVLNARDAMAGGGTILVETDECEFCLPGDAASPTAGVTLSVTDTGCGISGEVRAHLFEPFFTTKSGGRGTGLGLTTVQDIVNRNRGVIEIDSEVGRGTCFRVMLPKFVEPAVRTVPEIKAFPGTGGETVLLVEDNSAVREAAAGILRESGYRVLEAGSGQDAITLSRSQGKPVDLLLADIAMPGMSGRQLSRQLQAELPGLAVLHMTGFEGSGDRDDTDPVVPFRKPFTGAVLLQKVREILDARVPKNTKRSKSRK
ncbi:MAG TPA: PAS domain S-box protein [Terriglobales bacterium]|nr:PAS domain S-box protein [Terriglobales bacterium]